MLARETLRDDTGRVERLLALRGIDPEALGAWQRLDAERRGILVDVEEKKRRRNEESKLIGRVKSQGGDATAQIAAVSELKAGIETLEAQVAAIDTVDTEIRDAAAVESRARDSRRQGFTGKMAIHPAQVAPIHAAFQPSGAEVEWADRVLEAFRAAPDTGVLSLDGRMLDKPHIRQAERILAAARR